MTLSISSPRAALLLFCFCISICITHAAITPSTYCPTTAPLIALDIATTCPASAFDNSGKVPLPRETTTTRSSSSKPTDAPAMSAIRRTAPLVFPAPQKHTATVIFAHGLGDTGHGWASAVENWRRRQRLDEVKFVLPHAPSIPITANMGMSMPGWFDIRSRESNVTYAKFKQQKMLDGTVESLRAHEDEAGVRVSVAYFNELIQAEVDAGIPSERIVLGGFSQGGAMALYTGLTNGKRLGGVVGLSSWLVLSNRFTEEVKDEARQVNKATKVFMGHGGSDQLVRTELGVMSAEGLRGLGYDVTLQIYPGMQHSACLEELDDVENFLLKQIPALEK
ncbi:Phospholipase/Carboxylesterase-domain-containing protein [Plectosphaerella cucumerina]|uniref:Acyl-protein thioesterase 1 n=1 Tax=Plectosphaerella cucumerina TaxID=40658 RepID=A0A8K0TEC8_9PEZI|nr:Phospholipase/Carboxylesterase-domain-containing protein [Plectosphaerella cucumerina]